MDELESLKIVIDKIYTTHNMLNIIFKVTAKHPVFVGSQQESFHTILFFSDITRMKSNAIIDAAWNNVETKVIEWLEISNEVHLVKKEVGKDYIPKSDRLTNYLQRLS